MPLHNTPSYEHLYGLCQLLKFAASLHCTWPCLGRHHMVLIIYVHHSAMLAVTGVCALMQTKLLELGYSCGEEEVDDMIFGGDTESALLTLQVCCLPPPRFRSGPGPTCADLMP